MGKAVTTHSRTLASRTTIQWCVIMRDCIETAFCSLMFTGRSSAATSGVSLPDWPEFTAASCANRIRPWMSSEWWQTPDSSSCSSQYETTTHPKAWQWNKWNKTTTHPEAWQWNNATTHPEAWQWNNATTHPEAWQWNNATTHPEVWQWNNTTTHPEA